MACNLINVEKRTQMKSLLVAFLVAIISVSAHSQEVFGPVSHNGDTISCSIQPVTVLSKKFANNQEKADFNKLRYNVGKVYPYAKMAGEIYRQMKDELADLDK